MGKRRIWSTPMFTTPANYGSDRKRLFTELNDALIAVGLTQTADTGQLTSFDAVETAATASTVYGYRIYKITDELSIDSPIYLKLTFRVYFSNGGSTHFPDVDIAAGSGTDGAGNLKNSTPTMGNYSSAVCYTFSNTIFPNENVPSFVYSGNGITWVAVKCGYSTGNNSEFSIARADAGGMKARHTWLNFFITRPLDESGAHLPGYALGVPSCTWTTPLLFMQQPSQYNFIVDAVTTSGIVSRTNSPSLRVFPDVMGSLNSKAVIAISAGKFANNYFPLAGVISIPAIMVNSMDTLDIAIAGVATRNCICPHPGVLGLNRLDIYRNQGLAAYASPEIDTLMLAWDGVDV